MSPRLAALDARRARLQAESGVLREQCVVHARALVGPARAIDGARGLMARLRRLPLRLIVGLAREGLGEALATQARRATVYASVASGVAALLRRWRKRRPHHPTLPGA